MRYLSLLQEELGFSCKTFAGFQASNDSTSFTEFIYHMQDCTRDGEVPQDDRKCNCDLGVGGFVMNEDRQGRVDFVEAFDFEFYRAMTHVENIGVASPATFFLTSFTLPVWFGILALIFSFAFIKIFDQQFPGPDDDYILTSQDLTMFRRLQHFLMRSRLPARFWAGVQSTRTFLAQYSFNFLCSFL